MPVLDLEKSIRVAKRSGIKFAKHRVARTLAGVEGACSAVRFPISMKIISPKISHKTDIGGVMLGISNMSEAKRAYSRLRKLMGFEGVLLQEMVKGKEIIIGGKRDVQFGPTVLFGLGGIFVEVFKDFSIGICPLRRRDAKRMVREIRAYPILVGFRGKKGVNLQKVEGALLKVSRFMVREKGVRELDLNPLIVNEREVVAVDARVVV